MKPPEAPAEQSTIWQYAALSEYAVPSGLADEAVRGLRRLAKAIWEALPGIARRADEASERPRLPADVLADVLPRFETEAAASALESALGSWPAGEPSASRIRVVVGPPGANPQGVVEALARRRKWAEIPPPRRADLLGTAEVIPKRFSEREPDSANPVVIGELHRWLLRSEFGLPILRALLRELLHQPCPVLIGCDSWTWAFLDRTLGVKDLLGEPLALAAFDAPRLDGWLGDPVRSKGLACLSAEDNGAVFGDSSGYRPERRSGEHSVSRVLAKLASTTRGNPGPALELWQRSLCLARPKPDSKDREPPNRAEEIWAGSSMNAQVLVPHKLESGHDFVLHATLLHGGLEADLLNAVLPFSRHDLLRRVRDLEGCGLLVETSGELSVPPASYSAVRGHLESEDLLVDNF